MDAGLREGFSRSLADYDVLYQLRAADRPLRMGELADRLLVANSSCHRIVDRLAEDGLVERSHGDLDRREVYIALSTEGQRLQRRMALAHGRDIRRLFTDQLTSDERELLQSVFARLVAATSTEQPSPPA